MRAVLGGDLDKELVAPTLPFVPDDVPSDVELENTRNQLQGGSDIQLCRRYMPGLSTPNRSDVFPEELYSFVFDVG